MEKWREQLSGLMSDAGYRRKPAIRRSTRDGYLFATDFPQAADEHSVQVFLKTAENTGWKTEMISGWIELTRYTDFAEASDRSVFGSPEAACCLSLLNRYNGDKAPSDGDIERKILKALEEGFDKYDSLCRSIHSSWAAALRRHEELPDIDKRYFGGETR